MLVCLVCVVVLCLFGFCFFAWLICLFVGGGRILAFGACFEHAAGACFLGPGMYHDRARDERKERSLVEEAHIEGSRVHRI